MLTEPVGASDVRTTGLGGALRRRREARSLPMKPWRSSWKCRSRDQHFSRCRRHSNNARSCAARGMHRSGLVTPEDIIEVQGIRVSSPELTIASLFSRHSLNVLGRMADDAVRRRIMTLETRLAEIVERAAAGARTKPEEDPRRTRSSAPRCRRARERPRGFRGRRDPSLPTATARSAASRDVQRTTAADRPLLSRRLAGAGGKGISVVPDAIGLGIAPHCAGTRSSSQAFAS